MRLHLFSLLFSLSPFFGGLRYASQSNNRLKGDYFFSSRPEDGENERLAHGLELKYRYSTMLIHSSRGLIEF